MAGSSSAPEPNKWEDLLYNAVSTATMTRASLLQSVLGTTRRDINDECQYPDVISLEQYREMFEREGLGTRVVNVYPDECWSVEPEIMDTPTPDKSTFEQAWEDLVTRWNLYHYFNRLDTLSGVGHYGLMLYGLSDGKPLSEPVAGVDPKTGEFRSSSGELKLLYLRVFPQYAVSIQKWEDNKRSPRYGQPLMYSIKMTDFRNLASGVVVPTTMLEQEVHWSRVIHVADNCHANEVFGTPRQQCVFNRLLDLRKLLGGSAEMFWKGAFPGMSFETNPDIGDAVLDTESLKEEFQAYMEGLQRYLAVVGVSVKSLAPQVASPKDHVLEQLHAICAAIGVPLRIFMGSEAAQLASGQDKMTWNRRVMRRQNLFCTPVIIRQFIDRMRVLGVLPEPEQGKYQVTWPDLDTPTSNDKADVLQKTVEALARYVQGSVHSLMPPYEFLVHIVGLDANIAERILEAAVEFEDDDLRPLMTEPVMQDQGNGFNEPATTTTVKPENTIAKAKASQ